MVNYYCLSMHGRERVLAAMIALWADDGLTNAQRVRLLGHVCNHLRARRVHLVTAPRCAMISAPVFLANLFFRPPGPGTSSRSSPRFRCRCPRPGVC
jgi:hypothetical protein